MNMNKRNSSLRRKASAAFGPGPENSPLSPVKRAKYSSTLPAKVSSPTRTNTPKEKIHARDVFTTQKLTRQQIEERESLENMSRNIQKYQRKKRDSILLDKRRAAPAAPTPPRPLRSSGLPPPLAPAASATVEIPKPKAKLVPALTALRNAESEQTLLGTSSLPGIDSNQKLTFEEAQLFVALTLDVYGQERSWGHRKTLLELFARQKPEGMVTASLMTVLAANDDEDRVRMASDFFSSLAIYFLEQGRLDAPTVAAFRSHSASLSRLATPPRGGQQSRHGVFVATNISAGMTCLGITVTAPSANVIQEQTGAIGKPLKFMSTPRRSRKNSITVPTLVMEAVSFLCKNKHQEKGVTVQEVHEYLNTVPGLNFDLGVVGEALTVLAEQSAVRSEPARYFPSTV